MIKIKNKLKLKLKIRKLKRIRIAADSLNFNIKLIFFVTMSYIFFLIIFYNLKNIFRFNLLYFKIIKKKYYTNSNVLYIINF